MEPRGYQRFYTPVRAEARPSNTFARPWAKAACGPDVFNSRPEFQSLLPMGKEITSPRTSGGLGAAGPDPALKERLMLFGQFVGDWEIVESRFLDDDGKWVARKGEVHWNWILDGRALQDVWLYYEGEKGLVSAGTTLRFYNSETHLWNSIWVSPRQNDFGVFLGRKVGDEIVLELQEKSEHKGEGKVRWIFSEITQTSFRWHGEESSDGGKTWALKQEMRLVRRLPATSGSSRRPQYGGCAFNLRFESHRPRGK